MSHSFSKQFFADKFEKEQIENCKYHLFPLQQASEMVELIASIPTLRGLNVTIPHKVNVMQYLTEVDAAAKNIGAVNCISITEVDGRKQLKGYNTDAYGFEESIKPFIKSHHQKALIFGDGGAAKAVKYVLAKLGISFISVVRNPKEGAILYSSVTEDLLKSHTVLVNTTPLGTYPNIDALPPIPYQYLTEHHLAYDLVYNPEETAFLRQVKAQGGTIKNGLEMLHLQAERSWEIWNQ